MGMGRENETEEALMRAYVGGDRAAFERLFARLAPAVHAFFLRATRSPAAADDLLQTTFLHLHRARATWRSDLPLRPWVFAIAAHARQDALRRRYGLAETAGEEEIAAAEAVAADGDPEQEMERLSRAERVRAAIDGLPEAQRAVIHLHRFEGMGFAEIARVLGSSEGAVKLRAFRGYERLRQTLADLVEEKT